MNKDEPQGERIAKVMARAGVASRRDAERMILAGRVAVNGTAVDSPALDVGPKDRVTLDGKPIDEKQPTRLWLYYKPLGLVTSAKDEKGRRTVFDALPEGLPRVMSVGRLDLNSEGLLLLTNDGGLKRRLELPETGWLRKYRVRVNGRPNDATFDPLRRGVVIEGEEFQPMEVTLDKQQGANAWLTVGIREGRNREVRRAMAEVGLTVNRLIRVSYGPFRLNEMQPGEVVEVRARVLRDQLGHLLEGGAGKPAARARAGTGGDERPKRAPQGAGPAARRASAPASEDRPFAKRGPRTAAGERPGRGPGSAERDGSSGRQAGGEKPHAKRGPRPAEGNRPSAKRGPKTAGEEKPFAKRGPRPAGDERPARRGPRPAEGDKPFAKRGPRPAEGDKPFARRGPKPAEGEKPFAKRGPRPADSDKPFARRGPKPAEGEKPFAKRSPRPADGDKPFAKRGPRTTEGGKPSAGRGPRPAGPKPPRGGLPGGRRGPRTPG